MMRYPQNVFTFPLKKRLGLGAISIAAVGLLAANSFGSAHAADAYSLGDKIAWDDSTVATTLAPGKTSDKLYATGLNQDVISTVQINSVTNGAYGLYYGYDLRRQTNGNEYLARLISGPNGTLNLALTSVSGGKQTSLSEVPAHLSVRAGDKVNLQVMISGTDKVVVMERAWLSTSATPGWQLTYNDTSATRIAASGQLGVTAYASGTSASQSFSRSAFHAWNLVVAKPAVPVTTTTAKPVPKPTTTTTAKPVVTTTTPAPAPIVNVDSLASAVSTVQTGGTATLGSGTFSFSDFGAGNIGESLGKKGGTLQGQGVNKTVIQIAPNSSTKAGAIPTAKWSTNPLYLMYASGSPKLSGFTLQGTSQGHLYNGLMIAQATNAKVSNVKVVNIPGNANYPPGETFAVNDWSSKNDTFDNLEIDGGGIAASGFASNSDSNVTISNSNLHDMKFNSGAAFWQTNNVNIINTTTKNNQYGFGFERVTGTITMRNPVFSGNRTSDIEIDTDTGNATYNIYDPVYAGPKLVVAIPDGTSMGGTNQQLKSSIHVFKNGVDVTSSVVSFIK